jgi:hypothetical protein
MAVASEVAAMKAGTSTPRKHAASSAAAPQPTAATIAP